MADYPPRGTTRRELLKLSPLLALGAFAVPAWRDALVAAGLRWSDRASGLGFREHHLAATFADTELAPLARFPYNYFDVLEPEIDADLTFESPALAEVDPASFLDLPELLDLSDLPDLPAEILPEVEAGAAESARVADASPKVPFYKRELSTKRAPLEVRRA